MVSSVFVAALAATAVVASPLTQRDAVHKVGFSKKINSDKLQGFVARDRARAQQLASAYKSGSVAKRQEVPATNEAVSYLAAVGVGSPATTYDLIIDTGSSNTWVGAGTKYVKTSTSTSTGKKVVRTAVHALHASRLIYIACSLSATAAARSPARSTPTRSPFLLRS